MRTPFTTATHRAEIGAPVDQVWAAITVTSAPSSVYLGLSVTCDWQPDHPITLTSSGPGASTRGLVLAADRPVRLVHSLGIGDDASRCGLECTTWITWDLGSVPGGTLVTLTVDDMVPGGDDEDDIGPAMLHVLVDRFRGELTRPA